jgi:hypothetical protein
MLRTMGWEAGQGLGKQGTGIKEAIEVKKKEDTVGVRAAAAAFACCCTGAALGLSWLPCTLPSCAQTLSASCIRSVAGGRQW